MINQSLVVGDILFATPRDRCMYLGTEKRYQPKWLADRPGSWGYVKDIPKEAGLLVKTETEVRTVGAGPNVRKVGDDENEVTATVTNRSAKAELLPRAKAAMSEALGSQTETTPLGAMGRKRGCRRGRQLSPERMRIVLDSLREYPILSHAANKAGIHPKTLAYWIKRSAAGDAGYDIKWQRVKWRFHEHCKSAIAEAHDRLFLAVWEIAMGGVIYKTDQSLVDLGYEGPDAYLRDENGNPVVETIRSRNGKMLRFLLAWKRPDKWGKHRKIDVPHTGGVHVIGDATKKPENSSAASIKARKWKSYSRKIEKAKS